MPILISDSAPSLGIVDPNAKRGQTRNRLSASIDSYQAGLYGTAQEIADKFGSDKARDWLEEQRIKNEADAARASQQAVRQGAVESWEDVHGPGDLANYAAGLGIQSAPYLAESLAGGLGARALMGGTRAALTAARSAGKAEEAAALAKTLGRGQLAGSVAASYPSSVGDIIQNQREQTGGKADLGSAAALGIPYAALNALGLEGAVGGRGFIRSGVQALDDLKGIKGGLARMAVAAGKGGAEEALGETGQEVINQAGRMAVDPNATFTDPEALQRYKESAIGGGLLGGVGAGVMGGWKRSHPAATPTDLLDTSTGDDQDKPLLGIGYSPLAGTPIIFPDGSVALNGEQELQKRYGTPAPAAAEATPAVAAAISDDVQKAADIAGLPLTTKKGKVNKPRVEHLTTALTMLGDGVIDQGQFDQTIEQIRKHRYPTVAKTLAQLQADHAAKQVDTQASVTGPGEQNVSAPNTPSEGIKPGVPTGRVDVAGGVASTRPSPVVGGATGNASIIPPAANGEVSLLSTQAGKPTADLTTDQSSIVPNSTAAPTVTSPNVTPPAPVAPAMPRRTLTLKPKVAPIDLSTEDQLEIAKATGNAAELQAQHEEDTGHRLEETEQHRQDTIDAVLKQRFAGSENPERDIQVAKAYIEALKKAKHGSKGLIKSQIGARFGIGQKMVEKIGDTVKMVKTAEYMGLDPNAVRRAFEFGNNANSVASGEEEVGQVQAALAKQGITTGENEDLGFGLENDLWKHSSARNTLGDFKNAVIESFSNAWHDFVEKADSARAMAEVLDAGGYTEAAEKNRRQAEQYDESAKAALKRYEQALTGEITAAEEQSAEEPETGKGWERNTELESAPKESSTEDEYEDDSWKEEVDGENLGGWASRTTPVDIVDEDKVKFTAQPSNLAKLAKNAGFVRGASYLHKNGLAHTINGIKNWFTTNDPVDWDGLFVMIDGEPSIVFSQRALNDEALVAVTMMHELGHSADKVYEGGEFSGEPAFNLILKDGQVRAAPNGSVVAELVAHANEDSALSQLLHYPLVDNAGMTADEARQEIFAQLFAFSNLPEGMEFLNDNLPKTSAFMEKVHEQVRATKGAEPSQNQNPKSGQNQNRAQVAGNGARQSRSAAADQNKVKSLARQVGGATGQKIATDTSNFIEKLSHKFYFLHDLVEVAQKSMPSVKRWYDSMANTVATRRDIEQAAEEIADQAGKLKNGTQNVNEFLAMSTTQQKWGYDPKFGGQSVTIDPQMAIAFNKLTEEEKAVVEAVFAHGEKMRNLKKQILEALGIDKVFASGASMQGPYAPLMRFGNYVAVLKSQAFLDAEANEKNDTLVKLQSDPAHYVMRMFDTAGQAEAFAQANADKYALTDSFAKSENVSEGRAMNTKVLEKVLAAVGMDENTTPEARAAMEKLVKDIYFQSLDEHDARKSGLKRKNIAGFDEDMLRSFLSHARSEAGFLSNMKHGKETNAAFYAMSKEVKGPNGKRENQNMFNTIAAHYADSLKSKDTPWQDRAMAMTSAWQLGTSIGYHVTNATQGIMVTLPKLAADFNDYSGAWSALLNGYNTLKQTGMWGNIKVSAVKDEGLRGALKRAADLGVLDMGMDADLAKFDAFKTGFAGVDNSSVVARRALQLLRQVSRAVETANRVASATAAYNMAIKHGQSVEKAQHYAVRVLQGTQGDSSRLGSPLLLKQLPKVVGQYKKYQFTMAGLYVKAFHDAFISQDKMTRAVGRRMLGYKLFHTSVAAGVLGFPMMNLAAAAFSALGGDDEPEDLERSLREVIGDEDMADLLLHGPLAYMGLDMSAKLGEDKIFSILPYGEWDLSSASGLAKTALSLAGPAASQASKFADGIGYLGRGDYQKGIEKFMPSGVASALKAFREANDGYTLKNGDVMYQPEDISAFALALEAVGMPSTELKKMDWMRSQQYEIKRFYIDRTKQLEHDYDKAYRDNDVEAMDDIRDSWMSMQDAKDENRKYFNNNPHELRRQPLSSLIRYPFNKDKRERQLQQSSELVD